MNFSPAEFSRLSYKTILSDFSVDKPRLIRRARRPECDYYERMRSIRYATILLMALSAILPCARLSAAAERPRANTWSISGLTRARTAKAFTPAAFSPATGKLTPVELAAETVSPSFLAVDPAQHYLFAANEIGDYRGAKSGSVSSFAIDRHSGKLTALNTVASRGADPCHLTVDKNGKHVLVANYTGGSVAVLPVKTGRHVG